MIKLYTERLILRNAEINDVTTIHKLMNSEFIMKYNVMEQISIEEVENVVMRNMKDRNTFYIVLPSTNEVIGVITLAKDSLRYGVNSLMLEYYLDEPYTRQGYMSEALNYLMNYAFDILKVELISARAFKDNIASCTLLKKLGFTHEGTLRRCVKAHGGIIYDDMIFSITKEEYEKGLQ